MKRIQNESTDSRAALRESRLLIARQLDAPARRLFLRRSFTLGGLALLTGCSVQDGDGIEQALSKISGMNDRIQSWLFDPGQLAPTYPESMIQRPFPFNAFYAEGDVPDIDEDDWKLELRGSIERKQPWSLRALAALPQHADVTRHICVEGWSAIGQWGGVRFSEFLRRVGADITARYVGFECADGYHTSIDMPSALHPQTLLALTYDRTPLPARNGYPLKLRVPTKLGYKNPKHIKTIYVTNTYSGGYWEDQGYNWFGGS